MVGDQDVQDVVAGDVGGQLQQQAFAEVACADAGRVELLDQLERFLGLRHRGSPVEVADHVLQVDLEEPLSSRL